MKALALLLVLLAGCAAPRVAPVTPYQKDHWTCEHSAFGHQAAGFLALALYHDCMRAHGWSK